MSSQHALTAGSSAGRLTILLHVDASRHHHSVSDEIVRRALDAGLAGGSVFHGIEGYGASGEVHTTMHADVMEDLPCAVVIVDPSEERLRAFADGLDDLLDHGLVLLDTVEIARRFGAAHATVGPDS